MEQGPEKTFVTDKKLEHHQAKNTATGKTHHMSPGDWLNYDKTMSEDSLKNLQLGMDHSGDIFEDFFGKVLSEKPDYILLFDKGARPFATPFKKYLNDLHLEKTPEIVFLNPSKGTDSIQEMLKQKDIAQRYQGKKVFVVDEIFHQGRKADLAKELFDKNSIDGHFFAFASEGDGDWSDNEGGYSLPYSEKYAHDDRVTIYERAEIVSKYIASLYMVNSEEAGLSERRFGTVNVDPKLNVSQEELLETKKYALDVQRQASEIIYQGLKKLNLKMHN